MLREVGYLRLPPQQRHIAKADFNPYVYDLTKLGWEVLADHHDLERHCRPTGHWWHGYWVSAISSAIEIGATRSGLTYIPAAQILAINGVEVGIPVSGTKLVPDQLFAVRYPNGYRAYALEMDRGTEPLRSGAARKSLQRSLDQYQQVLNAKIYQNHYGLRSNLIVLWVFTTGARRRLFNELSSNLHKAIQSAHVEQEKPNWSKISTLATGFISGK